MSLEIDTVAHCVVASVFYFELNLLLQWHNSRYMLGGHIRCIMERDKTVLEALWSKLSSNRGGGQVTLTSQLCFFTHVDSCRRPI